MRLVTSFAVAIAAAFAFTTSAMADAEITATYKTSPNNLWNLIEFHQPFENYMPPIKSSTTQGQGVGAKKTNILKEGGGEVHLQLVYHDPKTRAFNYVIRSSPLPVKDYVGQVRVTDLGDGRAQLTWKGVFTADGVEQSKADEILNGFYGAIATGIGEKFPRE